MEPIKEIMARLQKTSLESQPKTLVQDNEGNLSITSYKGELTTPVVIECMKSIKFSFPGLPSEFYQILQSRIKANNFSDQRLIDAVNFVSDNCPYPLPTIAQFISFDRRIQVFTHEQMTKKVTEYGPEIWGSYKAIKIGDMIKPVWIHVNDIVKYKIEIL